MRTEKRRAGSPVVDPPRGLGMWKASAVPVGY